MNQTAKGLIMGAIMGAAISGLTVGVYFLRASNDALEAQLKEKQTSYYALVDQVKDLEAENSRLKTNLPR